MNDLSTIMGTICGIGAICFAGVIGFGIVAAVFGIQLFTDYFRRDEGDDEWDRKHEIDKRNPPSRAKNFTMQSARNDFDSKVEQYKSSPGSSPPSIPSSRDFDIGNAGQQSLRSQKSRNRRSMQDREDELFGGMLEDDDFI